MYLLVLNAGSSSFKASLFSLEPKQSLEPSDALWQGLIDWTAHEVTTQARGKQVQSPLAEGDRPSLVEQFLNSIWQGETAVLASLQQITAVGHRVVHGGAVYQQPTRITPAVEEAIAHLADLAPAHNPANLAGIQLVRSLLGPDVPQIAVFDTAFHSQMPVAAYTYPGPYAWLEKGWRRYGFHGISHQYCSERVAHLMQRPLAELQLITCHLGNGCSLAAVRHGLSVDTTMGFTPLEGLMMGSRSGSIDPGLLLHLMEHEGVSATDLDKVLNRESGFLGLSGVSADLRQVLKAVKEGNAQAQLALEVFVHRLRRCLGAMLSNLERLDALVFTAGMGENSPLLWQCVCTALPGLRFALQVPLTRSPEDQSISEPGSVPSVWVIHTREEWAIAQQCWQVLHIPTLSPINSDH